ncbi:hypothetical protein LAJ19_15985 (plasmid) [Deinococcus taeanensis]|uniref:hypothetical protein n=1 Tax=Deinococcus taeanensis TaxID=2737050 RepID=UPI001CDCFBB6|nr:hypothetical protein [Deinococcus taeanensis]UBV44663.1 hypothetical protein LAJ19_15985 [Deinococcus taeanensis]
MPRDALTRALNDLHVAGGTQSDLFGAKGREQLLNPVNSSCLSARQQLDTVQNPHAIGPEGNTPDKSMGWPDHRPGEAT